MAVARNVCGVALLLSVGCTAILGVEDYAPGSGTPADAGNLADDATEPDGALRDAARKDGDDAAPGCPSTTPITEAEVDALASWKAPSAFQNVCTQKNVDDLKALFKASLGEVTAPDVRAALGAACAACAVSKGTDPTWQVIVENGSSTINNGLGSCLAIRDGNACGQAAFRLETCVGLACPVASCGGSGSEVQCATAAQKGACLALNDAYVATCPGSVGADFSICSNVFGALATVCAGGPTNTINP